jgi:hypothetical protein
LQLEQLPSADGVILDVRPDPSRGALVAPAIRHMARVTHPKTVRARGSSIRVRKRFDQRLLVIAREPVYLSAAIPVIVHLREESVAATTQAAVFVS